LVLSKRIDRTYRIFTILVCHLLFRPSTLGSTSCRLTDICVRKASAHLGDLMKDLEERHDR
jgi:hypothetical protein